MEITTLQQAVDIILQQQEQIKQQQEQIKAQHKQIKQLQDENKRLAKRVEQLCAQLRKYHNVNTPSGALPPYQKDELLKITKSVDEQDSADSKQAKNNRNKRSDHDKTEIHQIEFCPHCGSTNLKHREKTNKRIVVHMHFPKVETIMHESKNCFCMDCKKEIIPQVPNTLPKSKYDLNISILIVLLYAIGTTQSKTQEILRWFGVEMCKTSVNNTIHRVQQYLGKRKYKELEEELKKSFFCGADETSHRHMGKTFWIWVATTARTVFFRIAQSRGSKEAKKLPMAKITSCDGYRVYDKTSETPRTKVRGFFLV